MIFFIFSIFIIIFSPTLEALETITVTADRQSNNLDQDTSSTSTITSNEIERSGMSDISQILQNVPGVTINSVGTVGQVANAFFRGNKSEHTLFLLDGIEMNDPISPGNTFNFASLNIEDIERVEVIRGTQSVLYGSEAIGGVVNIITKSAANQKRKGIRYSMLMNYGSYNSILLAPSLLKTIGRYSLFFHLSHFQTDGISVSAPTTSRRVDDDGYRNSNISAKINWQSSSKTNFEIFSKWQKSKLDQDSVDFFTLRPQDDPNYTSTTESRYSKLKVESFFFNDRYNPIFSLNHTLIKRNDTNLPDDLNPTSKNDNHKSQRFKYFLQQNIYLTQDHTLTVGSELEREQGESSDFEKKSSSIYANFLQYQYSNHQFFANMGVRHNQHNTFGDHVVYKIAPGYNIKKLDLTIILSRSSGFKAPTIYQLFNPVYGSALLRPETSESNELILKKRFKDVFSLDVALFSNKINNAITWRSTFLNDGQTSQQGVEIAPVARLSSFVKLKGDLTFTKSENTKSGKELYQRPKKSASFDIDYAHTDKLNFYLALNYIGKRLDVTEERMPGYATANLNTSYQYSGKIRYAFKIDNLLNKKYQKNFGYATAGTSWSLKAQITY